MQSLPIDRDLPRILQGLAASSTLVIEAPPGSGKTTRVPPALLEIVEGQVLVLEPRRLAARLAARRVASERGERVGDSVGYQVRFEEIAGPNTQLRYMTEGVLTRRMFADPLLPGVGAVVLDEFHERHLEGDLALALLTGLKSVSHDLRVVVMSATLESSRLCSHLGCEVIRCAARPFELTLRYTPHSAKPLETLVADAVEQALAWSNNGDMLVFLPGAAEIRRAAAACSSVAAAHKLLIAPLHGDLTPEEQDRAVMPGPQRKLILSTNVAESSVTVEGVRIVIDSGLARVAADSPWTGLPSLNIARVSRASCDQRAGRAARTAPGLAIRLYTEEDYLRRPRHEVPEIERRELSQIVLALKAAKLPYEPQWLDAPPDGGLRSAETLLARLHALDETAAVTDSGRRMARIPLHPRLSRLVIDGAARGAGEHACAAAGVLSAGDRLSDEPRRHGPSDLLALIERGVSPQARRVMEQVCRAARIRGGSSGSDEPLLIATLAAFPDRVARRRSGDEFFYLRAELLCWRLRVSFAMRSFW